LNQNTKNQIKNAGKGFLLGLLVFLLDQITKYLITDTYTFGGITLTPVKNTGGALGLFQGTNTVFIIVMVLVIGLLYRIRHNLKPSWIVPVIIGAGLGNLFDRIVFGHVRDFISIMSFPIFNVADAVITCSVLIIIWREYQNSSKS